MAPKQRLTKSQIREDKFVKNLLKAQEYFNEHSTQFIMALAAIVVIAAAVFFLISSGQAKEQEANEILGNATVEFRAGNFQMAAIDFQKVIDDFGGTDAAKFASFYLANSYFELKNYDQAGEYYRLHIDKHRIDDMLTASAMVGLAHCHRARGEMKEAGDMFYKAYREFPDSYVSEDCLYFGAESYAMAGEQDLAIELFEMFDSIRGEVQRAKELRQLLVEKGILDPSVGAYD